MATSAGDRAGRTVLNTIRPARRKFNRVNAAGFEGQTREAHKVLRDSV
jgi:hypothetical protein